MPRDAATSGLNLQAPFRSAARTWRGHVKAEVIHGFPCTRYELKNVQLAVSYQDVAGTPWPSGMRFCVITRHVVRNVPGCPSHAHAAYQSVLASYVSGQQDVIWILDSRFGIWKSSSGQQQPPPRLLFVSIDENPKWGYCFYFIILIFWVGELF